MNYPLITEYIEAIKDAGENFDELSHLRPVLGDDGAPVMSSGNFAVVFKMEDPESGKLHAVKCFTKEQEGRVEAYRLIADELAKVDSPYLTPIRFLERELFVDTRQTDETEFPVLLMDWVEGKTLDNYIIAHSDDIYAIHHIFGAFIKMAIWLLKQSFAHGDLKPDNIMIREDGTIVLVDYDGMFVLSMTGEKTRELGSPDFRHPQRSHDEFNDSIDVFAIASIALSLSYIAQKTNSDFERDLCFISEQDHLKPNESELINNILQNSMGTVCGKMLSIYLLTLSDNHLDKSTIVSIIETFFTDDTKFTDFDLNNSFTIERVRYSFDGRKLLEAHPDYIQRSLSFEIRHGIEILCDESLNYLDDDVIIIIPNSLSVIGENVFPDRVRRFISASPNFIDDEYGLFSADHTELIKIHESSKSILRLYPNTSTIQDYAVRPHSDTLFAYVEKNSTFYRLNKDWEGRIINLNPISDLYEDSYGAVYTKDRKTLLHFPINSDLKEYYIIEGCETIREDAFESFVGADDDPSVWIEGNSIETLHFPNSLMHINANGLLGCINLRNIFIDIYSESRFIELLESYEEENYGCRKLKLNSQMFCYETKSTDYDKDNSFLDEFGFRYTNDGLKLLSATDIKSQYCIREGVKIICDGVFYLIDCPNLTLPSSLISIGDEAFCYCSFENIVIPPNVKSIGSDAFMGEGLESITIKGNIRYMGTRVFSSGDNGSSLKKVELCEGILALGNLTFDGCYKLNTIELPSTLLSIGDNPFANSGITTVINKSDEFVIKDSCLFRKWSDKLISYFGADQSVTFNQLSEIGNYAFAGMSNLVNITIPNGVTHICDYAFDHCNNLQNIEIPESVISIGQCAFQLCLSLETLHLPKNILELKEMTFNACQHLNHIVLPKHLIRIGKDAFMQCPSLRTLELPTHLNEIIGNPFERDFKGRGVRSITCKSDNYFFTHKGGLYHKRLETLVAVFDEQEIFQIKAGTKIIGDGAFKDGHNIKVVDIPTSVISIGDYGFWGCRGLQYIILRENLWQIRHPYTMFEHCDNLKHIYIKNNEIIFNLLYDSNIGYRKMLQRLEITTVLPDDRDNAISFPGEEYNSYDEKKRMISYGYNNGDSYKIQEGTKVICDECFFDEYDETDGHYLTHLHIPKSVEFIGENPFCGSITSIKCDSPHFVIDGKYLLSADRKKLVFYFGQDQVINIPDGIETIGSSSFCSRNFNTLIIPSSVSQIDDNPFINSATVVNNLGKSRAITYNIISHSDLYIVRDFMLIDTSKNEIISYWGVDNTLKIPTEIKSIGANAFFGSEFETIKLHCDIEFIDETAFYWCFNLKKIIVPKGMKYNFKKLLMHYMHDYISEEINIT